MTRYDTIIVGKKRLRVKFVRSTKRHEFAARVFFIPFWQGGLCLRQVALSLSVQPFTNFVITEIIMVKSVFVSQHLLPVPDLGGSNACIIS